jgi:hypothetical protein
MGLASFSIDFAADWNADQFPLKPTNVFSCGAIFPGLFLPRVISSQRYFLTVAALAAGAPALGAPAGAAGVVPAAGGGGAAGRASGRQTNSTTK